MGIHILLFSPRERMTRLDLVLVVGGLLLLHGADCVDPPPPPTWPPYTFDDRYCLGALTQFGLGLENPSYYATNPGGAVFWSTAEDHVDGQDNVNMRAAQAWARATGRLTLEMTYGGELLQDAMAGWSGAVAGPIWNCASQLFARGATGIMHAFGRKARRQTNYGNGIPTYYNIELVEILNQNIDALIVYHYNLNGGMDLWCGSNEYHCSGCGITQMERYPVLARDTYEVYSNSDGKMLFPTYGYAQDEGQFTNNC